MSNSIKNNDECMNYSIYYYDYLYGDRIDVPKAAVEHFERCCHCKVAMEKLESELDSSDERLDEELSQVVKTTNLEMHFSYVNKPIACFEARQFLALMASSLKVNITTPITVHINNCTTCQKDLNTLKGLNLPDRTLYRIGQIMGDKSISEKKESKVALEIFKAVREDDFDNTTIDKLVEIICRKPSGVKTLFSLKDTEEISDPVERSASDDHLVSFTVLNDGQEKYNYKSQIFKISRYLKPVAVAAVLMVAFILFKGNPATAEYDKIYKSLENVKNVHFKLIDPDEDRIIQEIWVSTDSNVKLLKTGNKLTCWDIDSKKLITKDTEDDTLKTEKLDSDRIRSVLSTMQVPWSLLPFKVTSSFPEDAVLEVTENQNGIDIYNIIWTRKTINGVGVLKKWRGLINSESHLPERVELWEKRQFDNDFELVNIITISYPESQQILEQIGKLKN